MPIIMISKLSQQGEFHCFINYNFVDGLDSRSTPFILLSSLISNQFVSPDQVGGLNWLFLLHASWFCFLMRDHKFFEFVSFFCQSLEPKILILNYHVCRFNKIQYFESPKTLNQSCNSMDTHCKTQDHQYLQSDHQNFQKVIENQVDEQPGKQVELDQSCSAQRRDCSFMSKQEAAIFVSVYKQYRSKWSVYKEKLPKKQLNQIKNYFHNSIRNLALRLQKTEKKIQKFQRNIIDTASLHILLDLTYYFKISINKVPAEYRNLIIFKANDYILHYCFENISADEQELADLCKLIRTLKRLFKNLQMAKKNIKFDHYIIKMTQFMHRIEQRQINKQLQKQLKNQKALQISELIKGEDVPNEQLLPEKNQPENRQTSSPQVFYDYNMFLNYEMWKWNMIMYQYNQNPYGDYQLFQGIGQ